LDCSDIVLIAVNRNMVDVDDIQTQTAAECLEIRARSLAHNFERIINDGSEPDASTLDYFQCQIDLLFQHSAIVPRADESRDILDKVISNLTECYQIICEKIANLETSTCRNYQTSCSRTGNPGRPKLNISVQQLEYFIENSFSVVDIAAMLGVSVSSVRRRMSDCGINTSRPFSNISDNELCEVIHDIQKQCPRSGYRMMQGYLKARGYKIQQHRVREMMRKVDPEGIITRWRNTVQRRVYSVSGPNALWHIDGNHKLIRYIYFSGIYSFHSCV